MKMAKIVMIVCIAFVLALPCLAAKACPVDTVDIVHIGYGAHGIADVWGGGQVGTSVFAGVYMLDKTAGKGEGNIWPNGEIGSFCIELHQYAPDVTKTYGVVMPEDAYNSFLGELIGYQKAEYIRELWSSFHAEAITDNIKAEAFAAAIWEIIYEDLPASPADWDVTVDGTSCIRGFRAENIDAALANSWLHNLDGCGPKADLRAFVNCGKQDYIVEVPEPATIALLGFSSVFSLLRRKRSA